MKNPTQSAATTKKITHPTEKPRGGLPVAAARMAVQPTVILPDYLARHEPTGAARMSMTGVSSPMLAATNAR